VSIERYTGVGIAPLAAMTRIAFFGHDAADAAVRRRVQGFRDDGLDVVGFMMRRRDDVQTDWENVDLGKTFDGDYAQRLESVLTGAQRAAAQREKLGSADVIYARNLDMLATAYLARKRLNLKTPLIYESLDIHRLLTRKDVVGTAFRRIEGWLLERTSRLIVSSPAFLKNHFEQHYPGRYEARLIENRLAAGADYGPRPAPATSPKPQLRIGWVGVLRCWRSFGLLLDLARKLGDSVEIVMHGMPALTEIPDFHHRIQGLTNVHFHGRYRAPEDLAQIYAGLDVVWAGDFMEAGFNSVWLLPNRLYEGGYYGVPPVAPAGTQTAEWIEQRDVGFVLEENLSSTLPALIERLVADRDPILERRKRLLELPTDTFIAPRGELAVLIAEAIRDSAGGASRDMHQFSTRGTRKMEAAGTHQRVSGD
jgi:succinoglycan biosynthesis protein ExoL